MTTTKKRICLSDVDKRVNALKCVALAEKEQEAERLMADRVNKMMLILTEEYIREKNNCREIEG